MRLRRYCVPLLGLGLSAAVWCPTPPASAAAGVQATASVSHPTQYLADQVGKPFYLTVHSTGAAVRSLAVNAPSGWKGVACPAAPAGWTRSLTATGCRFSSGSPLTSGLFRVDARSAPGSRDRQGTWGVRLWASDTFTGNTAVATTPRGGLSTTAFSLEVTRVVVRTGADRAAGSSCPTPARSAHAVADLWLCGRNHSTSAVTLYGPDTTFLSGSFATAQGDKLVAAAVQPSAGSVILGELTSVPITGAIDQDSFLDVSYGGSGQNSPTKHLPHYFARNVVPHAAALSASTSADAPRTLTLTSTDGDGDPTSFELIGAPAHGSLGPQGAATCNGPASRPRTCTVDVVYTPDAGYTGPDSFAFTVNDGYVDAPAGIVRLSVTA
ncbi:MAG: family of calcium-binding protein [Frankiales bacterium]|nr:family of calcium-binding protein [Frankiales bacterium]